MGKIRAPILTLAAFRAAAFFTVAFFTVAFFTVPAFAAMCSGNTCTFTTADSYDTVKNDLANATYLNFIWTAGLYQHYTATLKFPCGSGQTYQGPAVSYVPGSGVSPTAIFNSLTLTDSNAVEVVTPSGASPGAGCTVEDLWLQGLNFYVDEGSGVLFSHVKVSGTLGTTSCSTCHASIYFEGSGALGISNSVVEWSTFGPGCSDLVNQWTYADGDGSCGAVGFHASIYNTSVINNNWIGPIQEGIKILSGSSTTTAQGYTFENNDLSGIHRIGIEVQPSGGCAGNTIAYNDLHDQYNTDGGSTGISDVNCAPSPSGATTPVSSVVHDNVIIANVPPTPGGDCNPSGGPTTNRCYLPYGIEVWGVAPQIYSNLIQGLWASGGIAFGGQTSGGYISSAGSMTSNTIQGPNMTAGSGPYLYYMRCEDNGGPLSIAACSLTTGLVNVSSSSTCPMLCTAVSPASSTAPMISPASGAYAGPQIVTLADGGTNTSIWYTTDGTIPVPGAGTAQLYTGPFTTSTLPVTINAVGMWGTGGNALSYPSGYGYLPSAVASTTYTPGASGNGVTLNGVTLSGVVIQ